MILGDVLKKLRTVDENWLDFQIKRAKGNDRNNRIGAFFEIFGLGFFEQEKYRLIPAPKNQKGFDGKIIFPNSAEIRLSLKNYGESYHNEVFDVNCKKLDQQIVNELRRLKVPPIVILIDTINQYPDTKQWNYLFKNIAGLLKQFKGLNLFFKLDCGWNVYLTPLSVEPEILHLDYQSYTLILVCKFHKNEIKNLIDKFDEAFYNLKEHSRIENDKTINFVYVKLPETASMASCVEWAKNYLDGKNRNLISGVIFYQPTVTTDNNGRSVTITHYVEILHNENYQNWSHINQIQLSQIKVNFPVGIVTTAPSELKIRVGENMVDISGNYVFQSGEHFVRSITKDDGSIEGHVSKIATGITSHVVFKPIPNDADLIITGLLPKDYKLLII